MNIKQTILAIVAAVGLTGAVFNPVYAETCKNADGTTYETIILPCGNNNSSSTPTYVCYDKTAPGTDGKCGDGSTPRLRGSTCPAGLTGPGFDGKCQDGSSPIPKTDSVVERNAIWGLLVLAINIMTAGIGIAAVGGILYGSILYTSSEGSAETTKKARKIISNVVIGLLMYALMYAFLNYMIPGGMFN